MIKPATIQDLDFIIGCITALDENEALLEPRLTKRYHDAQYILRRNDWARNVLSGEIPNYIFYIVDNKGFALISIKNETSEIYLANLFVLPEYRGMGLGSSFLNWLQQYRDLNYPAYSINLSCLNKNLPAQSLYKATGFLPIKKNSWTTQYRKGPTMQSLESELKNFACITKHYFDGVQDCGVIDMNSAIGNKAELAQQILEQRQELAEDIKSHNEKTE